MHLGEVRSRGEPRRARRRGDSGRPGTARSRSSRALATRPSARRARRGVRRDAHPPRREPREPDAGSCVRRDLRARLRRPRRSSPLDEACRARDARAFTSRRLFGASLARARGAAPRGARAATFTSPLRGVVSAAVRLGLVGPHEAQRHAPSSARRRSSASLTECEGLPRGRGVAGGAAPRSGFGAAHDRLYHALPDVEVRHGHDAPRVTTGRRPRHRTSTGRTPGSSAIASPRARATTRAAPSPWASAARSAAARRRSCSHSARALRDRMQPRRRHQRHLHARGRRVPDRETRRSRPSASAPSRPAAARTRRSARTSATTSTRSSSS